MPKWKLGIMTAALIALMWIVALPTSPALRPVPPRDSGVFLYIGDALLHGERLYADVWDHKPPVIYAINALGVAFGGVWGVWWIEAAFLAGAVALSVIVLRRVFSIGVALLATFAWVMAMALLIAGNQLEEYGLLFQFAALAFFAGDTPHPPSRSPTGREGEQIEDEISLTDREGHPARDGFLAGAALGLLLFVRPNLIGIGAAMVLYLVWQMASARRSGQSPSPAQQDRVEGKADIRLMALVIGGLAVVLTVVLLFGITGTLSDFWEAAFDYNFRYSSSTFAERFETLRFGLETLARSGLPLLTIAAWLVSVIALVSRRARFSEIPPLLAVALLALPLELLLASLSGRLYEHYFVAWLPVFAILTAYFAQMLAEANREKAGTILVALAVGIGLLPALQYAQQMDRLLPVPESNGMDNVIQFLDENTTPDDSVLVWGAFPAVNFMAHRHAPSRFIYQAPLYMPGFQSVERFQAFVDELRADPPEIIFDTSPTDRGIPPLNAERRQAWQVDIVENPGRSAEWDDIHIPPEMDVIFDYIAANYEPIGRLVGWEVYRRTR